MYIDTLEHMKIYVARINLSTAYQGITGEQSVSCALLMETFWHSSSITSISDEEAARVSSPLSPELVKQFGWSGAESDLCVS